MEPYNLHWHNQEVFEKAHAFRDELLSKDIPAYREAALNLRKAMIEKDHMYPKYHFAAPEGWMNTPDVYYFYNGLYHMFYQYSPTLPDGRIALAFGYNEDIPDTHHILAWGHAVSEDLLHWKDMPIAIWPDCEWDEGGALSGQVVTMPDGIPAILYNGCGKKWGRDLCLVMATPKDDMLNTWDKKVLRDFKESEEFCRRVSAKKEGEPDASIDYVGKFWQKDDTYYLTCGRERDGHGAAFLLSSKDLMNWDYVDTFFETGNDSTWETPSLFPLDGKYVLVVGYTPRKAGEGIIYWVGEYDEEAVKFTPYERRHKNVDLGYFNSHVPVQLADGRWIMCGYLESKRLLRGGVPYWHNCTSLPWEMYLYGNTLCFRPMKELDSLIMENTEYDTVVLQDKVPCVMENTSDAYKWTFTLEKGKKRKDIVVEFLAYSNGKASCASKMIIGRNGTVTYEGEETKQTEDMFDPLCETNFTIFVDRSFAEIFVEEKREGETLSRSLVMSGKCIYPRRAELNGISITGQGVLSHMRIGKMECIW